MRISKKLRGICRAVGVGLKWLLGFIVTCFEALPNPLNVQTIANHADVMIQRFEVEADEMASLVQNKANKQRIWLAMDVNTRQTIAFHVDDRSRKNARQWWGKIPKTYRRYATFHTDPYVVYQGGIPAAQHRASARKRAKPTILSDSTTRWVNGDHAWCVARYRFPTSWTTTSVPSSYASATTT